MLVLERLFTNYVQVAGCSKVSEDNEASGNISQNADGRLPCNNYGNILKRLVFFIQNKNLTFLKIQMLWLWLPAISIECVIVLFKYLWM